MLKRGEIDRSRITGAHKDYAAGLWSIEVASYEKEQSEWLVVGWFRENRQSQDGPPPLDRCQHSSARMSANTMHWEHFRSNGAPRALFGELTEESQHERREQGLVLSGICCLSLNTYSF